jgi:hypothetical protein
MPLEEVQIEGFVSMNATSSSKMAAQDKGEQVARNFFSDL